MKSDEMMEATVEALKVVTTNVFQLATMDAQQFRDDWHAFELLCGDRFSAGRLFYAACTTILYGVDMEVMAGEPSRDGWIAYHQPRVSWVEDSPTGIGLCMRCCSNPSQVVVADRVGNIVELLCEACAKEKGIPEHGRIL